MICEYCGAWHPSISALWACIEECEEEMELAQMEAEYEAEMRNERWFEERGGFFESQIEEDMRHSPLDPIWNLV